MTPTKHAAHDLASTLLGIRMVLGLALGALVALPLSLWTIGAMAVARRAPAATYPA